MNMKLLEIAFLLCAVPDKVIWGKNFNELRLGVKESDGMKCFDDFLVSFSDASWASTIATGASFDSREVKKGDVFFCFTGKNVDGHEYVSQAIKSGAVAIIAERLPKIDEELLEDLNNLPPIFIVSDTNSALWHLASFHRHRSNSRVIAITGTAGKTSVKEVLSQILSVKGQTCKNHLNRNNGIGLPISILNASSDAAFWIMEVGISEPKDMDILGRIVKPDVGIVLNVGTGHVEGLGDKGVAYYKSKLWDYVQPGGSCFYNMEYDSLSNEADCRLNKFADLAIQLKKISTHLDKPAYCVAIYKEMLPSGNGLYEVFINNKKFDVKAPFVGSYGSENVATIFSVALYLGVSVEDIISRMSSASLPVQRFSVQNVSNFTIIDDSYNSNPLSANKMLETASEMSTKLDCPLYLVLGEMGELGKESMQAHQSLGENMAKINPKIIFWKGGYAEYVKEGLAKQEYSGKFYPVVSEQEFYALLEELNIESGLVLFKGSRVNKLEKLVSTFHEFLIS